MSAATQRHTSALCVVSSERAFGEISACHAKSRDVARKVSLGNGVVKRKFERELPRRSRYRCTVEMRAGLFREIRPRLTPRHSGIMDIRTAWPVNDVDRKAEEFPKHRSKNASPFRSCLSSCSSAAFAGFRKNRAFRKCPRPRTEPAHRRIRIGEFSPRIPGELFRIPTRANGRWSVTYRGTVRLGGIYYTLQTAARQSADTPGTPITSGFPSGLGGTLTF